MKRIEIFKKNREMLKTTFHIDELVLDLYEKSITPKKESDYENREITDEGRELATMTTEITAFGLGIVMYNGYLIKGGKAIC